MSNAITAHFAPTGIFLDMDKGQRPSRLVSIPSTEAKTWDGAGESTNCTVESHVDTTGIQCYAELKITGRGPRRHTGGIWGWAARVRFTSVDDSGEWFSVVATDGTPW